MNPKKRSYHTLRDILFVVFKHRTLMLSFLLIIIAAAAAGSLVLTPMYASCAKLLVKQPDKASEADAELPARQGSKQATMDAAVEMLSGRYLAEKVIRKIEIATLYQNLAGPSGDGQTIGLEKALSRFRTSLTVSKGNIIEVSFLHESPALAARVVSTLIDEFLEYYLTVQKQDQRYEFFKNQVDRITARLQQSQKELGLFRNENNISSIQKQKSLLLLQISDLEVELAKIRADISEQESLPQGSGSSTDVQRRLVALKSKEKKLQQHITQYRLELNRLDRAETRLQELERQVKVDEENYLLYLKKMEEARIASAMEAQKLINFTIIESAQEPLAPVRPHKILIISLAVVLGCIGGLLLAFVSEYFTHTFDHREDIEAILNQAAIACMPDLTDAEMSQLRDLQISERLLDTCNRMRHFMERMLQNPARAVLLCSSSRHEGTSTLLLSLALCLAKAGARVLLVDADIRHPSLHTYFRVPAAGGFSDLLAGSTAVDAAVKSTPVANLYLVTSGTPDVNPGVFLQPDRFGPVLQELRAQADWVLFDAAPINTYDDAGMIGARLDGVVMMVKAGKTRWEVAASAVARLTNCNAHILGAVLSRQKLYIPGWLYNLL